MFHKLLFGLFSLSVSSIVVAKEFLDVLVIYDNNNISQSLDLDVEYERNSYAHNLVSNLNDSFKNSELDWLYSFNLVGQITDNIALFNNRYYSNIESLHNQYVSYFNESFEKGYPRGRAFIQQSRFKADVVIVIMKENAPTYCGKAISIPNKLVSNRSGITDFELMEFAGYGLFFISAEKECLEDETLAAHEFGHTAGLFHGAATDGESQFSEDKSNMFVEGAAGFYKYSFFKSDRYSTLMENIMYSFNLPRLNQFSDKSSNNCTDKNQPCGSYDADAISNLTKYASAYNKRGHWFDNN